MNAVELPEKIRAFVAIYPTAEIASRLEAVQNEIETTLPRQPVKWTASTQIHLTLQFLGSIRRDMLQPFENSLKCVMSESRSFRLRAHSLGCFQNCRRPKIVWAGLDGELEPLHALKEKLDSAFKEFGCVPEERKFHAHLTLARIGDLKAPDARRLAAQVQRFASENFGEWVPGEVCLMRSELSPHGARHHLLNAFAFGKV